MPLGSCLSSVQLYFSLYNSHEYRLIASCHGKSRKKPQGSGESPNKVPLPVQRELCIHFNYSQGKL